MKYHFFKIIVFIFLISSCSSDHGRKLNIDVSSIDIGDFDIIRYEQDLFAISPDNIEAGLKSIQSKYWFFLGNDLDNIENLNQLKDYISDPNLINLFRATEAAYPNLNDIKLELKQAFQYFRYYFPNKNTPNVYTYISGLQYEYPVQLVEHTMIIGLDLYLGSLFDDYRKIGIPEYKIAKMTQSNLTIDCMTELAYSVRKEPLKNRTFLDEIIQLGKIQYFLDATLPEKTEYLRIGYTEKQLMWCEKNEGNIWAFIIDNQILYTADYQITRKFITDGPFTLDFSKNSPARIGQWIGWQIVRSYMNTNKDISLAELFDITDSQEILSKSKYKPTR
ncbi:MAG: hypothetical protein GY834_02420 [Bacteroidetes bacterium]|nr:hypothetical protein [Bacteroidota bacterium]